MVERAGEFAETLALRGYASVQLAAAGEILGVGKIIEPGPFSRAFPRQRAPRCLSQRQPFC